MSKKEETEETREPHRLAILLPVDMLERIDNERTRMGLDRSSFIKVAIDAYLSKGG